MSESFQQLRLQGSVLALQVEHGHRLGHRGLRCTGWVCVRHPTMVSASRSPAFEPAGYFFSSQGGARLTYLAARKLPRESNFGPASLEKDCERVYRFTHCGI